MVLDNQRAELNRTIGITPDQWLLNHTALLATMYRGLLLSNIIAYTCGNDRTEARVAPSDFMAQIWSAMWLKHLSYPTEPNS